MKTVYLIHGWEGSPKEPMHVWIKKELEKNNFSVVVPEMPNPEKPEIESWVGKLNKIVNLNEEVYFIGHSIGCQTILRFIEGIKNNVKGVVLIAPWTHLNEETIEKEGEEVIEMAKPWIETPINWKKIKTKIESQVVCLFSDNDPYVPLSEADLFKEKLKAKIIIEHNKGHFDPDSKIKENSTAVSELLKIKK